MSTSGFLETIRDEIAASPLQGQLPNGERRSCITFRDYMHLCLYHPDYGYYRSGEGRVGRTGDFYTSAYIGDVMGGQLAAWIERFAPQWFPGADRVEVVDWGGGTGRLGRQMLDAWASSGSAVASFRLTVVDANPAHLSQARELLADATAAGRAGVMHAAEAEAFDWKRSPTVVVANELLDAFPVHRVAMIGDRLTEQGVAWDQTSGRPMFCSMAPSKPELADWLDRQQVRLAENQVTEIGLEGANWMAQMADRLGDAVVILIDYGDETKELTGRHRMDGTLMMYERHIAHADPFRNPGGQDMTAHVDFDLVRAVAVRSNWTERWYGTQKRFLVESGVLEQLSGHSFTDPFHPVVRRNRAIRQLLLSDGMSELFKVQIWSKSM